MAKDHICRHYLIGDNMIIVFWCGIRWSRNKWVRYGKNTIEDREMRDVEVCERCQKRYWADLEQHGGVIDGD